MWAQYRKTVIPMQILIVAVCAYLSYSGRNWQTVGLVFATMQFASILGAWWGVRLRKQLESADKKLPLDK
jgi:hypothetical protein